MESLDLQPTPRAERIRSLDFLRGIAVLGILLINIESFAYPDPWSPYKYGFASSNDHLVRFWVYFLAQGKFFSMFTFLFGVGFYLFLERIQLRGKGLQGMDTYAKRLLWLFLFGVIHAYIIWDGDILYHYAVCGFLLFPFRSFTVRQLMVPILLIIAVLLINSYENTTRTRDHRQAYLEALETSADRRSEAADKAIDYWENRTEIKVPVKESVPNPRNTIINSLAVNAGHTEVHSGAIFYQGIFFRTMLMMLLGILFYKTGIFTDFRRMKYYWLISFLLLGLAIYSNYMRYYQWTFRYYEPITSYWSGFLVTFPKELMGLSYILLLNGIYQVFLAPGVRFMRNTGRMALTNYISQSLICGLIFYGFGLDWFNKLSRLQLLPVVLIVWAIQIVFSNWWMSRHSQGPLEALWRKLTYGKKVVPGSEN